MDPSKRKYNGSIYYFKIWILFVWTFAVAS